MTTEVPRRPAAAAREVTPDVRVSERIYDIGGPVKAPVVVSRSAIDSSECDVEGKRLFGIPIAEVVVDSRGAVSRAKLVKGVDPCIDQQFLLSLRAWKFRPGTIDGKPVSVRINFTLHIHYR